MRGWPSTSCRGYDNQNIRKLRDYFPDERIDFHDWFPTPEEQIKQCLFPIRNNEIESIEIDDVSRLAVVTLRQNSKGVKSTDYQKYVPLCETVTGYQIEFI